MTAAYPITNAAGRAFEVLREEGLASFWFKLASALGYRRLILLERSLMQDIPRSEVGLPLQIAMLEPSEVNDYAAFRPGRSREHVLERLRLSQGCFVARYEGRIISACWTATRPTHIAFLNVDFAVATGEVYMFDAFTAPAYRGRGVAVALCLHQLSHFRRAGRHRAMRAVLPENASALRAHMKSGFRPYGLIRTLRLGPWQWTAQQPWHGPRRRDVPRG